jgi:hypothetical protein
VACGEGVMFSRLTRRANLSGVAVEISPDGR